MWQKLFAQKKPLHFYFILLNSEIFSAPIEVFCKMRPKKWAQNVWNLFSLNFCSGNFGKTFVWFFVDHEADSLSGPWRYIGLIRWPLCRSLPLHFFSSFFFALHSFGISSLFFSSFFFFILFARLFYYFRIGWGGAIVLPIVSRFYRSAVYHVENLGTPREHAVRFEPKVP